MFTLLAAGTGAFWLVMPISILIVAVLAIIVVSYRQTIRAYPNGGGSYIVARENLGQPAGLVAAAAPAHGLRPDRLGQRRGRRPGDHLRLPGLLDGLRVSSSGPSRSCSSCSSTCAACARAARSSPLPTYVFLVSMLGAHRDRASARRSLGRPPQVDRRDAAVGPAPSRWACCC